MLLPSSQLSGGPEGYYPKVIYFLKARSTNILFWYFFLLKEPFYSFSDTYYDHP